jgi:hypothetical protein
VELTEKRRDMKIFFAGCVAMVSAVFAGENSDAFRTKFDREFTLQGTPTLVCKRVSVPPVIDGEVDKDTVWQQCEHTKGAWAQIAARTASGRQTVAYTCFDNENLYFAFVCEEPELQNVKMEGNLATRGLLQAAGSDDCVEAVLEVGGTQGEGEVYSFRANLRGRSQAWGLTQIPANTYTPVWKSAGKLGPNRWMAEMAIPFSSLKRTPGQKGFPAPLRGDVLGLKFVRYGAATENIAARMVSTWNTEIAFTSVYIAGSNGLLFFEDSNVLRNASFEQNGGSPWTKAGDVRFGADGAVLAKSASLSQSVTLRPNSFYILNIRSNDSVAALEIDGKKVTLNKGGGGYWTGPKQTQATITLRAEDVARISNVTMQYQPGEEPPGPYCLTNNYRHSDRNIRTVQPEAPEGRYQYVDIDYAGKVVADGNPAVPKKLGYGNDYRVEDAGGRAGWISFGRGSLTGHPGSVFWTTNNPKDIAAWGRVDQVVDIDLGQEYFVQGLDVLWAAPNTIQFEIWGKAAENDEWTYLYAAQGQYVEPSSQKRHRRASESVRKLDSVVRYLRWRAQPSRGDHILPQMDGIQEFWVWGEPKGTHTGIKPFQPWLPNDLTPAVKAKTAELDPDAITIVPRPRSMQLEPGWFLLGPDTRIVAQDSPEAKKVARQIKDEIFDRWRVEVPVVADGGGLENCIYLGVLSQSDSAKKAAATAGLEVNPERVHGYGLKAAPSGVTVIGCDDAGLFYGVQSLMMAMRWRNLTEDGKGAVGVRAVKILDWPGTLDRTSLDHKGCCFMFALPPTDIERARRLCRLHARFKMTAVYAPTDFAGISWPEGAFAQLCREVRAEYHFEIRPVLQVSPGMGATWNNLARATDSLDSAESNPDERADDFSNHLNFCPLDPHTYDVVFSNLDEKLRNFGEPSRAYMFGAVNPDTAFGGRWEVCTRCARSGIKAEQLYAQFLRKIGAHLKERNSTLVLRSTWIRESANGPKEDRPFTIAFNDVPESIDVDLRTPETVTASQLASDLPYHRIGNGPANLKSTFRISEVACYDSHTLCSFGGVDENNHEPMARKAEQLWYSPEPAPQGPYSADDLATIINSWWYKRDYPGWRAGCRAKSIPLDLRPFANHGSHPTGGETLESGRPPEVDLRYLPLGRQVLANVQFDIIDPAANNGKSLLVMGRPAKGIPPKLAPTVCETTQPIPVNRKIASLAFLRCTWQSSVAGMNWREDWLRPTCRVVFDDESWLVADCFMYKENGIVGEDWNSNWGANFFHNRCGWLGNCPGGSPVRLLMTEWINPYPERTVKCIQYFTPNFDNRVAASCETVIGITAIEPIEQDIAFWSKRTDRPPPLPPLKKPSRESTELTAAEYRISGNGFETAYKLKPFELSQPLDVQGLYLRGFEDFGGTQTFDKPVTLCRVDVRGPVGSRLSGEPLPRSTRGNKVNVKVEISPDGTNFRKVGELSGISGEADFMPIEFPPETVKAVRLTGSSPPPYHETYFLRIGNAGASGSARNIFFALPYLCPHFHWKLYAPKD